MELVQYIRLFRKWLWLILLAAFIGGGISFIVNTGRPLVYTAQTTISIGRYIESPNPNYVDIRMGIELAQTYAQIIRTTDVLQATLDTLNLTNMSAAGIRGLISTRIIDGTSLMVVTVTYIDPVLTADIANTLAEQLILQSPTNLTADQQAQVDSTNERIAGLADQVRAAQEELNRINNQLREEANSEAFQQLMDARNITIEQINQASATIAQFTSTIVTLQQRTNSLQIIERARIPTTPSSSNVVTAVLLGAMVGAAIAVGIALVVEYLDDTIRTTEDAVQTLALPVLGAIARSERKNATYESILVVNHPSMSPIAESYRTVRTNLLYSEANGRRKTYIITSPAPEEGKSVTAANLAITMAQAGLQVLLVDADLRRPKIHEILGLENSVGLSSLLLGDPLNDGDGDTSEQPTDKTSGLLKACLQKTAIRRLSVITSGFTPANPTEILGSTLMQRWGDVFYASTNVDVILFDTPPCLMMADSAVLAAAVKGDVVLVLDSGHTRRAGALHAKEKFSQLGITIRGVVVNRVNPRDETYGYGYGYGYGYYTSPPSENVDDKGLLSRLRRSIGRG